MSHLARLGKDSIWLLFARIGTQGLMVLVTLLIARRLGEVGMGEYAFMAAAIFLSNALTTFGTDMLLIRDLASGRGLTQLSTALVIQLVLSVVFVLAAFAGAPALPGQSRDAVLALQIYSLALLPLAFYTVFTSVLRGRQRMDLYTLLNLAVSLIQVVAVWGLVRPGGSVVTVAALLLGVQLAAAVLGGVVCAAAFPELRRSWVYRPRNVLSVLRASAPIALLGLLGMLYQKLSVYMLATLSGAAMTGWFSAALRVVEASKTGHLALFGALYPAMAYVYGASAPDPRWRAAFRFSWQLLMAIAVAAALVLFALASPLVALLYGPAFEPSAAALRVLAWMMIPYTINTYLSLRFVASGQEKRVARSLLASLAALALLSGWWIPRAGLAGACQALLAAEILQSGMLLIQSGRSPRREGRGSPNLVERG